MKRAVLILAIAILSCPSILAQTKSDDAVDWAREWKYAFSKEGRKNWKPEITGRVYAGFITGGPAITGGVRIDDKRTLGLMLWKGNKWIDSEPAHVYSISTGLYIRRYVHFGKKDIVALYNDIAIGAGYVYKINCEYRMDPVSGEPYNPIDDNEGDVFFCATWQPGIRIRLVKNLHIFLGPTLATNTVGFHLGAGF